MYAIDVGTNQLDWKLRNDSRVKSIENKHINDLEKSDLNDEIDIISVLVKAGLSNTRSEARRNVEQGGVSVDGNIINDIKKIFPKTEFAGEGKLVKRGKKSFCKVKL